MFVLVLLICFSCTYHCTDAFCERLYKNPFWSPKTAKQRASEADIVIYGNVSESPCVKPIFRYQPVGTVSPPSNFTNSTSSFQPTTTPSVNNNTELRNNTNVCLSRGLYNVTLTVLCVIKGGTVPREVHLTNLGFGPQMCTYFTYNYIETIQSFHVYRGLTYLIFLGRNKGRSDREGFWPHNVNLQFAAMEITDEKFLKPIFEVAGGHAHSPPGMLANETLSICTPYIASAGTNHMKVLSLLFLLFLSGQTLM